MNCWTTRFHLRRHIQLCCSLGRHVPFTQHIVKTSHLSISRRCGYAAANGFLSAYGNIALKKQTPHSHCSSPPLSRHQSTSQPSISYYQPPQSGVVALLPRSWIPYAELLRLDKPTGTYYLFFPCLYSTLLAATMTPSVSVMQVTGTAGLFFAGALVMRGAGCAINDLWDRNLDPRVERTKYRPIARGAIPPGKAIVFTGAQLLAGLGILLQFPPQCLWYGIPSLLLVTTYPLAKRVTYYPQAVLGLTFSWGAIMGFPALGADLLDNNAALGAAAALYSSCVAWTILYDMIYAHMDIKDDIAAGIKSIALRHENNTKVVLSALATLQVGLLAAAGVAAGSGPIFFFGSCGSAIVSLGLMIRKVQLQDARNCWWWFKNGCLFTGGGIATGMFLDYVAKYTFLSRRLPGF
ncbi:4-hydroxybenzoate polyprenyl transferase [Aspergillus heteromorphus CBS 117.55]|uniref:4-hydroxybenzoate polyprenyltransferase, mitochondrial n=1 Tax=Aspergillus heteromorphus CBS 117.55 TaxID=1448321 RepID=A0A317UP08_9EURO|nr:4-hydroxybenzoate polyprenyl transferase [Aspergillus heteromorphus CBS 117.55]PWY63713.1 4-hydroxybenzoate polyprenyl transferase [Aspergillus heteromorphus CBS 117.55]